MSDRLYVMRRHAVVAELDARSTSPEAVMTHATVSGVKVMGRRLLRDYGSLLGLLLIGAALSLLSDRFLTTSNLINVARQVSINAIVAAGMTIVIITGGIDLSVGSTIALAGCAALLVAGSSGTSWA